MNLLIKNVTIVDTQSSHNGQSVDLLIENGRIKNIQPGIIAEYTEVLDAKGACVSPGWMDVGVQACDPGYEHREDLQSAARAAAAGGFTAIAVQPNTNPAIDSKSEVLYIKKNTQELPVDFYPIGAVSEGCRGKDITEMLDMRSAGALAFSDGKHAIEDNGLMLRALQYVRPFAGVIINQPLDTGIAGDGQMHEGIVSTTLGMRGIPSLAEELMVERDLYLLAYTDSNLHLANISTAGAVQQIREAKNRGLHVTASVAALNLVFDDDALNDFDSNFKVLPPVRSVRDREALIAGLLDGTIDFINSNHVPVDEEGKKREFPYASFGAIGLETAFAASWSVLNNRLSVAEMVRLLAVRPRVRFGLPVPSVETGQVANLTIFDPNAEWIVDRSDIRSKSKNSPFIGRKLMGRVLAIIHNYQSEIFHRP